jgi:ribonucleoside-diphosphate reductase alpha chain
MLTFTRQLSKESTDIQWTKKDVIVKNQKTGEVIFECLNAEFPSEWSLDAQKIVASKYFRQSRTSDHTETSIRQMVTRVVDALAASGIDQGYFSIEESKIFSDELSAALYGQYGSFNSPVWFNLGVPGVENPQCSACFINEVDDNMESILSLAKTEGLIFKDGSGSGVNLSRLRGSHEQIKGGGTASGPVSFMQGYDAFANVILSGGRTRRAARMVLLDVDHPDIYEFIKTKADQEDIVKTLAMTGMSTDFTDPKGAYSVAKHQSGNNSVRVTDAFMTQVRDILHGYEDDAPFNTVNRTNRQTAETTSVKKVFRAIAEAAHKCGDPGLQFSDTIESYNTCPNDARIRASNPCSEYVWFDNSACNLASLNLCKFTSEGVFDHRLFRHIIRLFIIAQDIIVELGSYPTPKIAENSHKYRTLGLGYANLGGLLMSWGLGYDSDEGRDLAASITSCMTAYAYQTSAEIAKELGAFERYEDNKTGMEEVLRKHQNSTRKLNKDVAGLHSKARTAWKDVISTATKGGGLRNAQVTLLAPTGTIAFMMDCATTGIEPDIGLKKIKTLVGGDIMEYTNPNVPTALRTLGYTPGEIEKLLEYLEEHGHFEGLILKEAHLRVFDCALAVSKGMRQLSVDAHINMCAAVQPFLSGAISKTFNMPHDARIEDIERAFLKAWEKGVKCITIYRDDSKMSAPLRVKEVTTELKQGSNLPTRVRLPNERRQQGHRFDIGVHKGYLTVGFYPDGKVGELFLRMAGHGSTVSGLLDSFATLVSLALQYGIPLEELVERFEGTRFPPAGWTQHPEITSANSVLDYVFRWIKWKYLGDAKQENASELPPAPVNGE